MKTNLTMSALSALLLVTGCASPQYQSRQSEYNSGIAGALVGGTLGGVIGNNVGDRKNDVLGAALGALAGGWVGQQYGQGEDQTRHRIEALESEQEELHGRLADPALYQGDGTAVATAKGRLAELESELTSAYARWEALEARD